MAGAVLIDQGTARATPAVGRAARAARWSADHPVLVIALVAAAARIAVAVAIAGAHDGLLIPDEKQYLGLARHIADGGSPAGWKSGYGAQLVSTTGLFVWPLVVLFEAFGPYRMLGQLLAAAAGVIAAAGTAHLALGWGRPRLALLAGGIAAVWPSQVLWSSVAIRESCVWAALVLVAVCMEMARTARTTHRLVLSLAGVAGALFALAHAREQTFIVVAWCCVIVAMATRGTFRRERIAMILLFALLLPLEIDASVGGIGYVTERLSNLDQRRADLAEGANTAIVDVPSTTQLPGPSGTSPGTTPTTQTTSTAPTTPTSVGTSTTAPSADRPIDETDRAEDDERVTNVKASPRGLVAFVIRPLPWETGSAELRFAAAENVLWYGLYALAAVGVVVAHRRQRLAMLALPLVAIAGIVAMNAISQGNVGTAFRHRGQLLWAFAIAAAMAIDAALDRRRAAA